MTSASFHTIPIDSIIVNRDERQRRQLTGIDELAASIAEVGLINPILINRETHELIAGERRLSACKSLGWTSITIQYQDEIEPFLLKLIELEENVKRVDLPWQDQVNAIAEYHRLRKEADPEWNVEATAKALGTSRQDINDKVLVAEEMKVSPKVATAERYSIARNVVRRINERRAEVERASLVEPEETDEIINADFIEWAKAYIGPKFNFIHCDFPYGINANKMQQGHSRLDHGDYDDSEDVYFELLRAFSENLDHFAEASCHLMFWFSMKFYTETLQFFRSNTDFVIDPFPLIWYKSDNIGLLPDPQRGPRRVYETCLLGARGDRKIISAVSNVVALPTTGKSHMSEKPVPVLSHFFRMIVDNTTQMLDPTCGSGTTVRAALLSGANRVLGIERDKEFYERAKIDLIAAKEIA